MAHGHLLGLRLFLEGVEIPVIGAQVTVAPNAPAVASIQVIATDKMLTILPRTVVHLFFYDFVDTVDPALDNSNPEDVNSVDYLNSKYKLLFMGEVQGVTIQKDAGTRAGVLNCVDFSNYWDTTYQYNFQGSLLGGRQHAAFIGANANFFTSPLGHGVGTIAALLNGRSVNFPHLTGLLGGIVRILEAIGGSYYGETTFKGANDFTSIAELRIKLLQQIIAAEKDSSTAKLFAHKTFSMWMNRQMGSLGKLVTFRGVVDILQKFIFHEIIPNPCAKYQPRVDGLKKTKTWAIDIEKDPRARQFIKDVKYLQSLLKSAKKNLGDMMKKLDNDAVKGFEGDMAGARKTFNKLSVSVPNIKGLNGQVVSIDANLSNMHKLLSEGGWFPTSFVKVSSKRLLKEADQELEKALDSIAIILGQRIKKQRQVTYAQLDRVNNQVLRPDLWFAAPPRCNVLFPDMYYSFVWSRNFLREVSRIELQTTNEILGDDALFNGRYYAPNVADMRKGIRLSSRQFGRLIMQHELLTGIIPMFEKITEANLFAMKSKKAEHKGAKVSYAQRAVNHQYFKHRFASRQMSADGRFNPWFVPGFPALLIDRPMTAEALAIASMPVEDQLTALDIVPEKSVEITRATLLQYLVPVQYLGSCVQVTHMLSQQGGATSYAFQQARVHREDTEFLGVDKAVVNKKIGNASKTTVVGAVPNSAPKVKGRGPRGGLITKVVDVSSQYNGKYVTVYNSKARAKVGELVSIGRANTDYYPGSKEQAVLPQQEKQQSSADYFDTKPQGQSTLPQQEVRDPNKSYLPKSEMGRIYAYQVTETFTRRARVKVDLPIEEAIRPPWIWDGWTNLKIGETYMQFFGTNAITDVEGFTSKELLASAAQDSEAFQSLLEAKEGQMGTKSDPSRSSIDEYDRGPSGGDPQLGDEQERYMDKVAGPSKTDSRGDTRRNVPAKSDPKKTVAEEAGVSKLSAATLLTMEKERTIENSIDYLVRVYSLIQSAGLDLGTFIRNYTWRPIATLVEILGSDNFTITEDPPGSSTYKTSGDEGFHSRAFGDSGDLFGLVNPKVKQVLGLTTQKNEVARKLDVRGMRRKVIREYADELTTRGLLG